MGMEWNGRTLDWLRDASDFTGYDRRMADLLLARIPERTTLCDVGCGAGLVDLALAPRFGHITCVDTSPAAIGFLTRRCRELGLDNITPLCLDGARLEGQWDTVIALFHGGTALLPHYRALARRQLLLVTYTERKGRFGPVSRKRAKRGGTAETELCLRQAGIPYTLEHHALEHGQPLRSRREAEDFVRTYALPMGDDELGAYLDASLRETGREDYPFFLPNCRQFGLFTIPGEDR